MTAQDLAAIVKGVAPAVLQVVSSAVAPLALKLAAIEARVSNIRDGRDGEKGKDAEPIDLDVISRKAADLIPVPALVDELKSEIVALREQLAASEVRSADFVKEMREWLSTEVTRAKHEVKHEIEVEALDEIDVKQIVTDALAGLPVPEKGQDGRSLTAEDVAPLIAGEVEKAVKALPVPKDGVGVAGALIDKDGLLVLTLSDGTMKELGLVVGRDGEKGKEGIPGTPGLDGINGKDGTLENIVPVLNERTLSFQFKDGTPVEGWSVKLPMLIDRGVYSSEKAYEIGDVTSYGGSGWICKADCQGKQPGTDAGAAFWRLAVKRGNDGKPGTKGLDGKDGKPGPPGRDGTRSY